MKSLYFTICLSLPMLHAKDWSIASAEDWRAQTAQSSEVAFENGTAAPTGETATLQTTLHRSDEKRSAKSLTITQSAIWQNWNPIDNLGPSNLGDAPVMIVKGPNDYWILGRYSGGKKKPKKTPKANPKNQPELSQKEPQKPQPKPEPSPEFKAKPATVEGFDIPLLTTPFPNQFNAPGGLKRSLGGYHAWQSRDMKTWVHHGPVSEKFSKWVTNAEFIDGKAYIYYDFPNDQDPHVYIDSDLTDGKPGENKGMAVKDPSHGSDAGFIRDLEGNVHCIIEDWSPISANKRSWDSPLAGRFVSPNGYSDFVQKAPAVDNRTTPTGEIGTFNHPHWVKEDPDNYQTSVAEFEIHQPEQEAYGDWAAICIGGQYYLFGDYDPAGGHKMSVGWFTSPSIDEQFTWCDHIGNGHPDPDVCFAEGQFYLATQQKTDYVSPGPWVEKVEARVGVDTNNDGAVNQWGDWAELKESYDYIEGFAKQVARTPAQLDLASLPEGYGFQIELKLTDTTENKSKPIIEALELSFE